MASQRASITKELLRESLESVLKPFKIHSLDDGKFSCVLEFLMGRKIFVNQPNGSGTQLVVFSQLVVASILPGWDVKTEEAVLKAARRLPNWRDTIIAYNKFNLHFVYLSCNDFNVNS